MEMSNGYFQLICKKDGSYLKLFPAAEDGEAIDVSELTNYLMQKNILYDLTALNNAIRGLEEVTIFKLNDTPANRERECCKVTISPDKMQAVARFFAPAEGGELMTKEEFLNDLAQMKIVEGIREDSIDSFFRKRTYCTDIIIAEGKEPRHGTDARIEYYFNVDLKVKPTVKDDGSVDFFHLNTINHCDKGDMLAKLIPEDAGEYGINVLGEKIKPRDVHRAYLKFGKNIKLGDNSLEIYSEVNGHVTLVEGKVFVSNVFEVENVDNNTGNVDYEGSIQVNGNICENFTVKAKGDVEIRGVVEGAYVEAGGDIIIARGMNGMGKGTLKAGGNIVSKFLENVKSVMAGGYITTESILHSTVMARSEVTVSGRRGFITGGKVCAGNTITVKTLGSSMGADTIVEVGSDPSIKMRLQELQTSGMEINKILRSIQPIIDASNQKIAKGIKLEPEQLKYALSLMKLRDAKNEQLRAETKEMFDIENELGLMAAGQIIVTGEVYPGTKICIGDISTVVKSQSHYCRYIKEAGDIKMVGM